MENRVFMRYTSGSEGVRWTHSSSDVTREEAKRLAELPHNIEKNVHVLRAVATYYPQLEIHVDNNGGGNNE